MNKLIKYTLISFVFGLIGCGNNKLNDNTIGYWSFDNISGNSIIDESNFGNNAYTDVVKLYKGYCGNGLIFGQSKDEAITVPYSKSMNPERMAPTTLTFEAYVKIPKFIDKKAILFKMESRFTISISADGLINTHTVSKRGWSGDGSTNTIKFGKWTHIAVVLNEETKEMVIYINKEFDSKNTFYGLVYSIGDVKMAYFEYWTPNDYLIDEIRLTYAALDPDEFLICK